MRIASASLAVLFLLGAVRLTAQSMTLAEATRLRDAGEFAQAARVLRELWAAHPEDASVARLLAQTLYWMHDISGAGAVYVRALDLQPQDAGLRLEYARMLAETGDRARARQLLEAIAEAAPQRADALSLLGTLANWDGEWTAAQRLFRESLQLNPAQPEARRQLREIRIATAPWARVAPLFWHDDQPLDRRGMVFEAGWHPTPLTPIRVRVSPVTYESDTTTLRTIAAEVEMRHAAPRARLQTRAAFGIVQRRSPAREIERSVDWTGRASVGVRLPQHVTATGRVERAPYLNTVASLGTRMQTTVLGGELHLDHPRGWLGEAALEQQRYPDGNQVRTAYAWLLAPLVHRPRGDFQAGYAFTTEDALESRFQLAALIGSTGAIGRYDPYYTPSHVVRHSAITALSARTPRLTFRASGDVAFHATEDAPTLIVSTGLVQRIFVARDFSPWVVRSSLDFALGQSATLGFSAEAGRLAFYRWSTAGAHVTFKLIRSGDRAAAERQ